MIAQIKALTNELLQYCYEYYVLDSPTISDKEYDKLYDQLLELENKTGFWLANSPTRKVQGQVLEGFEKVTHSKPMLSAAKTKDINEIKKFVGDNDFYCSYKLDGCFKKDTKIKMADGTQKFIQDIKVGDFVLSFDENTKKISSKKVTNVFYNGKKEFNEWVRLNLFKKFSQQGNFHGVCCTKNHKILTPNGWKHAVDINIGDTVYYYDYILSEEQKSVILGMCLGDGSIINRTYATTRSSREIHYSKVEDDRKYHIVLERISELFQFNNPKKRYYISGYGSKIAELNLHTLNVPEYMIDSNNILRAGLTFTKDICKHLTKLSLAIFYIDDGSRCPSIDDGYTKTFNKRVRAQFAMNRHNLEDVKYFSEYLNNQGYINHISYEKPTKTNGDGYHIILTTDGTEKFYDDIAKYIPKEIRAIKLGLKDKWQKAEEYEWWSKEGEYGLADGTVYDKKIGFKNKQENKIRKNRKSFCDAYDLEVEGNHTYFANNYPVHNCTLVTIYEDGQFKQAITRGTGLVGEDVTEQAKMISNLPMSIPYKGQLELRGECVISWENFNEINNNLEKPYSHPRNLAAGSLRQLDTNITRDRRLSYIVFECVSDLYDETEKFDSKWDELGYIHYLGFETVERRTGKVEDCIKDMKPEDYEFPVDGLIFELCSKSYSKSLVATSHHEGCRIALKWRDDVYETILQDIEWNPTRTGLISPTAVFQEINLDGALTTRATLHNVSIIEGLELGIGDTITVYRSNMVIPKIDDNLTRSGTYNIPNKCPCCEHDAVIKITDGSKFLTCTNPDCPAKIVAKFTHFVSRNAMNIDGLSEKTIELLIENELIHNFNDIYWLKDSKKVMMRLPGMGKKSVEKLLSSIEKSRNVKLENFITALGIEGVGNSAAKDISKRFNGDIEAFKTACYGGFDWTSIDGIGEVTANNINTWMVNNFVEFTDLIKVLNFVKDEGPKSDNSLEGLRFCITGSFSKPRDELKKALEARGAIFVSSVSKNLDVLFAGDKSGSKLTKAKALGVRVANEEELMEMLK